MDRFIFYNRIPKKRNFPIAAAAAAAEPRNLRCEAHAAAVAAALKSLVGKVLQLGV